ncbi:type II secretion system protein [Nodosilinea sp. E11]|uniref:PilW family protein n=1 Tax=Nodosilinea sp. E11 TaxID=3037479 RepID=UPI002934162E|nr:type II secretion system protein [Nodosilinea sp. E11]WOD38701.1 type II secretion system protein [Nodosilinea sp. E11]
MSSNPPSLPLTRWILKHSGSRKKQQGFTLIELLIAIVVGSIIIGSLLYLVVELLGVNAREERLTQAQQDTRRALDYITRDVREAVYVYSTPDAVMGQLNDAPAGASPVLAFWRLKPINVAALPATCPVAQKEECETLKVRQNVYDLVIYFHRANDDSNLWSGPRRIIRYELSNYSNLGNLTPTSGYSDPSKPGNDFAGWERGPGNTRGNAVVLTDFIDNHSATVAVACPTGLVPSPANAATTSNNFFICVREPDVAGNALNQSLYMFLRGSTATGGVTAVFGPTSQGSSLPTLSTEVQVRGVVEKNR